MRKTLSEWQKAITETAKNSGWHTDDPDIPERLCLIHSEVSEALQEARKHEFDPTNIYVGKNGKLEGFPIEIADVVIRCMHLCEMLGIDLEDAIREKNDFNKTRPYKHGKRF